MPLNRLISEPQGRDLHPPLIIAHGLFGSARNWGGLSKRFAGGGRRVVAVDMRNHGDSFRDPSQAYEDMAGDLAEVIAEEGGEADLLGHSMGGKAAMALALTAPRGLRRLIVADIAPVAYAHSHSEHVAAMQAVDLSQVARRADADRALAEGVPDRALRAFLIQSLAVTPEGARWKLNLEALGDQMGSMIGWPDLKGAWQGPALFLSGGASDYVSAASRPVISALFPGAVFEVIDGAGHWLHAEAPGPFAEAVERFLDG
ncbi:MAG: alpha/beta fold hydrolase [Pseudomonadota bacterium]